MVFSPAINDRRASVPTPPHKETINKSLLEVAWNRNCPAKVTFLC